MNVYVGYDRNLGDAAFQVCAHSIRKHATIPVNIIKLDQSWLRRVGLYKRTFYVQDGQQYDTVDGKPFSTEFSFTRFLVPSLQPEGWAIFCDSDFLFLDDIAKLVAFQNSRYAAMCVKHDFSPEKGIKMTGQVQEPYHRKNWSSLMMWNCSHHNARCLTPYTVNTYPGGWLHQLTWLPGPEIGSIPERWNWLDGHSSEEIEPSAVHFTRGTPDMGEPWDKTLYAQQWLDTWGELK